MTGVDEVRIGARASRLSMAHVTHVADLLADRGIASTFVPITTKGDTDRRHLTEIGGTGVFAQAVREAVLAGTVDLAVHSAKDLPTAPVDGLAVIAHPTREQVNDVLVGRRLDQLTDGSRIGSGSPRRAVQLQAWAQQQGMAIEVVPIRGNVESRLDAAASGDVDAVLLAAAGLRRLGLLDRPTGGRVEVAAMTAEVLDLAVMLPAAGQGALALEVRSDDERIVNLVRDLDDPMTTAQVVAERSLLATLEAGCLAPVGAAAAIVESCGTTPDLTMGAVIGRTTGNDPAETGDATASSGLPGPRIELIRVQGKAPVTAAAELGDRLGTELLAELGDRPGWQQAGTYDQGRHDHA
ncbi:hydroxymethylbilane synthase [Propionibacteriaceae bacterium Y2011]|uniref:hydroxymethylbilane synthase n=1 Tax=Microlunatus sp. Y2014 TaxID=3418488 RepID=UPI003B4BB17E